MLTRRAAVLTAAGVGSLPLAAQAQRDAGPLRCDDLSAPPPVTLAPAEQELHAIYLSLAMALVFDGWGVDRGRADLIAAYAEAAPGHIFPDYLGHNVGALLVDRDGRIVCFALNRNVALNSTIEHAEARAVRAGIDIANAAFPGPPPRWSFGALLQSDRIYTTLESCAQCAGIMDLANIGATIYGQDDPGQHRISNILYNLRGPGERAPLPMPASFAPTWEPLRTAYTAFAAAPGTDGRTGLTSFLQTVPAWRIYRDEAARFDSMSATFPENAAALLAARAFRARWGTRVQGGLVPD